MVSTVRAMICCKNPVVRTKVRIQILIFCDLKPDARKGHFWNGCTQGSFWTIDDRQSTTDRVTRMWTPISGTGSFYSVRGIGLQASAGAAEHNHRCQYLSPNTTVANIFPAQTVVDSPSKICKLLVRQFPCFVLDICVLLPVRITT